MLLCRVIKVIIRVQTELPVDAITASSSLKVTLIINTVMMMREEVNLMHDIVYISPPTVKLCPVESVFRFHAFLLHLSNDTDNKG